MIFDNIKNLLDVAQWQGRDCHPEIPRGKEFHQLLGAGAVSVEEAMCLYGLVLVARPDVIIELGTSRGASTLFLGAAAKDLGIEESVVTVDNGEVPPRECVTSAKLLGLNIKFESGTDSLDFLRNYKPESTKRYFVFSDTHITVRPDEVKMVFSKFPANTMVVVHDTSKFHPIGPMELEKKLDGFGLNVMELPSPRGLSIVMKRQDG